MKRLLWLVCVSLAVPSLLSANPSRRSTDERPTEGNRHRSRRWCEVEDGSHSVGRVHHGHRAIRRGVGEAISCAGKASLPT